MSLVKLVDNNRTDKNTAHSYLGLYDALLCGKKLSAKNIIEIGIGYHGGSIKLWHDYFENATVFGLDCMDLNGLASWNVDGYMFENKLKHLEGFDRIKLMTSVDAYNSDFFISNILKKDIKYDLIVDDGPHTLETMVKFLNMSIHI